MFDFDITNRQNIQYMIKLQKYETMLKVAELIKSNLFPINALVIVLDFNNFKR